MKSTGIVRKIDNLGRVVLPIELRRIYGLESGSFIEISVSEDKIILEKFTSRRVGGEQVLCDNCRRELTSSETAKRAAGGKRTIKSKRGTDKTGG
ncbi:MAG: AbrB/MazE/SpoVT family DNA-binding domain-containing protein [Oscillospiraceae bacterium]|nr:AbrB/MazE/SpoVT family DNA-binding domain-containing protein [Oscillospiraceae bacterium]